MGSTNIRSAWITAVVACALLGAWTGCGDPSDPGDPVCGNGTLEAGEECDDGNTADGDGCSGQCTLEGDGICSPLADVTDLIGSDQLFFGYAALGTDLSIPDCGALVTAKEIYVSLTPDFDGELVLSTVHPTTHVDTVIEIRDSGCDGASVGCVDGAATSGDGARITIPVQAGKQVVAMVETSDDEGGVFALSLHEPGVCEGLGTVQDITASLLTGLPFVADTTTSTTSMRGSCSPPAESNPEALLTFTAPNTGVLVATTAHPDTGFDTLLYVREGGLGSERYCDSAEAEVACGNDTAPWGTATVLRFDVLAGRPYSLFVDGGSTDAQGQATVILGYEATSPAPASLLGCNHTGIQDQFAFFAEAGQAVYANADTADSDTAADLRLRIRRPDGSEVYEADDDMDCTYPPPAYSCPEYGFSADTSGLHYVEVYVGTTQSCFDHSLANYQLTVKVDDQHSDLILTKDQ
jgi:cysteine-rich repeat protein